MDVNVLPSINKGFFLSFPFFLSKNDISNSIFAYDFFN